MCRCILAGVAECTLLLKDCAHILRVINYTCIRTRIRIAIYSIHRARRISCPFFKIREHLADSTGHPCFWV